MSAASGATPATSNAAHPTTSGPSSGPYPASSIPATIIVGRIIRSVCASASHQREARQFIHASSPTWTLAFLPVAARDGILRDDLKRKKASPGSGRGLYQRD